MAQPLTLTTAVGLFIDLLPAVYADENNFDERSAPTDRTTTAASNLNSSSSTTSGQQHRRGTVLAPEEELMPGLVYVTLAGMTGSFIARQKGPLLKALSPVAFASAAGYYFLPHTTRNLLGVDQASYDKWAASRSHSSHPHSHLPRADLNTQAHGARHIAGVKVDVLQDKTSDNVNDKTQEVKNWWNTNTAKVEDSKENLKDQLQLQLHQTKSWVENKADEADKVLDSAQTKVVDAVEDAKDKALPSAQAKIVDAVGDAKDWVQGKVLPSAQAKVADVVEDTKDWVQDKAKLVDRNLESTAKDASSWWTSEKASSPSIFPTSSSSANGDKQTKSKTGTEKSWFHHKSEPPPAGTHSHRSKWWSSRTKSTGATAAELGGTDSGARDHWSSGEEQGTAKVRDSNNESWFRKSSGRYGTSDGLLDNKDVDRWSSTGEEIGTAKMDESPYAHKHQQSFLGSAPAGELPRKPEYWSNGEEISSADIRDDNYYKYAGSSKSDSLGRTSWWDKRPWGTSSDTKGTMSGLNFTRNLAMEQSELEKKTAEAKTRAETAARQAKTTGETHLRERQLSMERSTQELEQRLAAEKMAADRAAEDAKARAHAWELEQLALAEKAAKEVQDRVAHEKDTAEAKASQAKAKAEAWAREQMENADMAAKKIHGRFLSQTAAAEKAAQEAKTAAEKAAKDAKAALETMIREEKTKLEHNSQELEERVRVEKAESDAREAKSRAESFLQEKKNAAEHAAKEMADLIARESSAKVEREARLRTRTDGLKEETQEASHTGSESGSGWNWPWSSKSGSDTVSETTSAPTTHTRKRYDSTEHLVDHIIEDIKQTKGDIEDGMGHLKDAVLGARAQATHAGRQSGETAQDAENVVKGRGTWTYGSIATIDGVNVKASDFGQGVKGVAAKAERDVKFKAEVNDDDKSETARKAYDNVIDAATSLDGQLQHRHRHHEHDREFPVRRQNDDGHNFSDHIRDDLRQTKENIQQGVEDLKGTVYNAEQTATEGKSWLNTKTRQAEEKASRLESELRTGLNKASDKIHGMDRGLDETLNPADREAADDFWFRAERDRQRQEQRRGSGRAM